MLNDLDPPIFTALMPPYKRSLKKDSTPRKIHGEVDGWLGAFNCKSGQRESGYLALGTTPDTNRTFIPPG